MHRKSLSTICENVAFFLIFIKFKHIYTILIINNINCNAILIVNLVNNYLIVLIKKFKRLPQQSSG